MSNDITSKLQQAVNEQDRNRIMKDAMAAPSYEALQNTVTQLESRNEELTKLINQTDVHYKYLKVEYDLLKTHNMKLEAVVDAARWYLDADHESDPSSAGDMAHDLRKALNELDEAKE